MKKEQTLQELLEEKGVTQKAFAIFFTCPNHR